jgi:hypothetical protein
MIKQWGVVWSRFMSPPTLLTMTRGPLTHFPVTIPEATGLRFDLTVECSILLPSGEGSCRSLEIHLETIPSFLSR